MANNPLDSMPEVRKNLYLAQWIINGILGVVSIVLVALGENPQWFLIVQAVFNFLWTYTGITAQGNTPLGGTPANPDPVQPPEAGEGALNLLVSILLFLVVLAVVVWLLRLILAGA